MGGVLEFISLLAYNLLFENPLKILKYFLEDILIFKSHLLY